MSWQVYLSGEIHTDWRERIERGAESAGLDVEFTGPVTDQRRATTAASRSSVPRRSRSGRITSAPA